MSARASRDFREAASSSHAHRHTADGECRACDRMFAASYVVHGFDLLLVYAVPMRTWAPAQEAAAVIAWIIETRGAQRKMPARYWCPFALAVVAHQAPQYTNNRYAIVGVDSRKHFCAHTAGVGRGCVRVIGSNYSRTVHRGFDALAQFGHLHVHDNATDTYHHKHDYWHCSADYACYARLLH
jgi:hypothetical protein